MKRGQQWSFEVILALSIFIIVFIFMISFLAFRPADTTRTLELQSAALLDEIRGERGFLRGSELDLDKFKSMAFNMQDPVNRSQFKRQLGIAGDFCIFVEYDPGRVVKMDAGEDDDGRGQEIIGIGDDTIQFLLEDCACDADDCSNCLVDCSQLILTE